MNEKHFTLLTVRIPPDLQGVLEELSVEKGESVSTVVRAMIRKVAADVRRSGHETVLPLDGLVPPVRRPARGITSDRGARSATGDLVESLPFGR